MHRKIVIALVFAILSAPGTQTSAGENADSKEATYVAATAFDHGLNEACIQLMDSGQCPITFANAFTISTCAGHGGLGTTGIDGLGGVRFCVEGWVGKEIDVRVEDDVLTTVDEFFIGCSFDTPVGSHFNWSPGTGLTQNLLLYRISGTEASFPYPQGCTDLFIVFASGSATTGTVHVWA